MRRLRLLVAAVVLASASLVVGAAPASANCAGEPNVCVLVCQVGLGNKHTRDLFEFCYVW